MKESWSVDDRPVADELQYGDCEASVVVTMCVVVSEQIEIESHGEEREPTDRE